MAYQESLRGSAPPGDTREALIQRIVSSAPFQRSPRQRELLLFIAAEHLAGRADEISEQHIGRHVFGRLPGYNQAEDNIVRVAVRQLRLRLASYFEEDGRDEPWLVEIPKGAYRLEFRPRPRPRASASPAATVGRRLAGLRVQLWAALGAAAVCLLGGYVLGGFRTPARVLTSSRSSAGGAAVDALFAGDDRPVNVVVADSSLVLLQALGVAIPTVDDYSTDMLLLRHASVTASADDPFRKLIRAMPVTSIADVSFVAGILNSNGPIRTRIRVRHAREISGPDLSADDVVLLGGPRVNPWAELFEPQLNFKFQFRDSGPGCFLNESPESDEARRYGNCKPEDAGEYARVAWVPNLRGSGHVLLISGNSMLSTEGASDFLLERGSANRLRGLVGLRDFTRLASLELLLRVSHRAGAPSGEKLLAWRARRL